MSDLPLPPDLAAWGPWLYPKMKGKRFPLIAEDETGTTMALKALTKENFRKVTDKNISIQAYFTYVYEYDKIVILY